MIAVDTSAIMAVLLNQADAGAYKRCLAEQAGCISAVSLQEASMVIAGRTGNDAAWQKLDELIRDAELEVVAHDRILAQIARQAFLRFGKGRHAARLNCGDCASYALARKYGIPLLFKGTAFAQTDIVAALPAPA